MATVEFEQQLTRAVAHARSAKNLHDSEEWKRAGFKAHYVRSLFGESDHYTQRNIAEDVYLECYNCNHCFIAILK